ncbi:unnamed protein product [Closterium sp. NIES-54]
MAASFRRAVHTGDYSVEKQQVTRSTEPGRGARRSASSLGALLAALALLLVPLALRYSGRACILGLSGLTITRSISTIAVASRRQQVPCLPAQVLQRFDFTYSSPQATPLSTRHSLSALPSDESVEPSGPYPELVACLMYLMTCTRPDLAYPLSILARYVAPGRHRPEHMAAAKRVLRYLCSTLGLGLVLGGRRPVVLTGHADASWADDQAKQRSSQGYTFSLGSGSVSWRSTRSSSVLGSSCFPTSRRHPGLHEHHSLPCLLLYLLVVALPCTALALVVALAVTTLAFVAACTVHVPPWVVGASTSTSTTPIAASGIRVGGIRLCTLRSA